MLASSGWDGTVWLWRMSERHTREPIVRITDATGFVRGSVFSPDGGLLATASDDGLVRIYDVGEPARPVLKAQFVPLSNQASVSVAFSPDGRTLAVGSFRVLTLWDVTDLGQPREISRREAWFASLWVVDWSPDGMVRLWDVTDPSRPQLATTYSGHVADVRRSRSARTAPTSRPGATTRRSGCGTSVSTGRSRGCARGRPGR